MTDLAVRCECGEVRGTLRDATPERGNHVLCYCHDCRAFAQLCGGDALDAGGGTELVQSSVGLLGIEAGGEHLACVRLTARGPVRWYAACCETALFLTLPSPALPFVTLVAPALGGSREARDAAVGPVAGAAFTGSAKGPVRAPKLGIGGMARLYGRFAKLMVWARRRGHHRLSPLHRDGRPIAEPRRLDEAERQALRERPLPERP